MATLSNAESSSANVNAALSGFASQYGLAVQIDRNAPVAAQASTVFGAMNPQLTEVAVSSHPDERKASATSGALHIGR